MSKRALNKDFVTAECGATIKQKNFDMHYRNCRACRGKPPTMKSFLFFPFGRNRDFKPEQVPLLPPSPYKKKEKL